MYIRLYSEMLRFVEAFDCGRETILVLEYLEGGELFERIVDEENELLESDCCFYLRQICGVKVKSSAVCVNFVFPGIAISPLEKHRPSRY